MRRQPKEINLTTRVTKETRDVFFEKASHYGTPSEVLREFVTAFIEDRLQIAPPVISEKESLYVTRKQD